MATMRVRAVSRLLAATAAVAFLPLTAAWADAPAQQGWWSATNPAGLPAATQPPDVPPDGLLVEGGVGSPGSGNAAFAALLYDLAPHTAVDTLTLMQTPSSASTPGATLIVCPLDVATIDAEQGGPMSDAPAYDCTHSVTVSPRSSTSGATLFQLSVAHLVTGRTLAVAILPADASTRVVLNSPGASSLRVTTTPTTSGSAAASNSPVAPAAAKPSGTTGGGQPSPPDISPVMTPAPAQAPVVAANPPVAAGAQPVDISAISRTAVSNDTGNRTWVGALVAAIILATVLWSTTRSEREDGSVGI